MLTHVEWLEQKINRDDLPPSWTSWEGGECPCAGKPADVMFRSGDVSMACVQMPKADGWTWEHHGHDRDIIAYRIVTNPDF